MTEPTKKDVLDIAEYLGCNGEELWSEMSKLLERQDKYAKRMEARSFFHLLWDEDGAPFERDDPPREALKHLEEVENQ